METIKLTCKGCGAIHNVKRTSEIADNINSLLSNWCPLCEDDALEPYEEWQEEIIEKPFIDPDQLNLFN